MRRGLLALLLALVGATTGACGDFESPEIVLDLRILNIRTEPPEIVSPFDPENPMNVELVPVDVCAFVADPNDSRRLTWGMVACAPTDSGKCDEPDRPFVDLGTGTVDDPEEAAAPVRICATIPDGGLVPIVLEDAISADSLAGFGGIALQVEFWVRDENATIEQAEFAKKRVVYAPKFPEQRVANTNPRVGQFIVTRANGRSEAMPLGRCVDQPAPLRMTAGETITIYPSEPDGVREDYVLPTFDLGYREFTENMRYNWYSTEGNWSDGDTGGPIDPIGNEPVRHTEYTAPSKPDIVGDGIDVQMWFVQRDERAGSSDYEACVHVEPAPVAP